ncbi:glycosyltransferase family 4 protein [Nitrospira moscoviensis]|nr:glycosyltransferase family 4 protein [Nitrospira moscoviensis]
MLAYCDEDLSVAAGGARQVLDLAAALTQRGHEVTIVAPQPIAPIEVPADRLRMQPVPVVRGGAIRPLSFLLGSMKVLGGVIRTWRPDVFLWFDSPGQLAPLRVLRHHECPVVYFVNGLPEEEVQGLWRWAPIRQALSYGLRRAAARAQAVVTVCPEICKSFGTRERARCTVIRNGVDPVRFSPQSHEEARAKLSISGTGPYIGFVGGFFPWHGLETLIHAVPMVAESYPGLQLFLVGEGRTKGALEDLVQRRGLGAHVRFVGRVEFDAVPAWVASFDVCVVLHQRTRSYPGDSMKLWEYLACGRPVVTTAGPGYGDTVEAMGAGLSAKADDAEDLARQLRRLLADRAVRAAMGERGRTAVVQSHTWAARAAQLESVCRRVLSREELAA